MKETAGPPQPILIQAGTDTEPETLAAPKTTVNTLGSTEPSDASFVAFCRLCERLLATLEPVGKGHFKNRETAVLVKKALNDPTSLTSRQQKRFVSAVSRRLDDLSAGVADEFQKSEDHALYTSVVEHYMGHGEPTAKTRETGAATSPVNAKTSVPQSDLETAVHEYKVLKDNPPGSLGLVGLGLLFSIGGPVLAVMSALDALFNSGVGDDAAIAFTCFGGIGLGGLLVAAGTAGGKRHEKATNEAFQRMVSLSTTVKHEEPAPSKNRWLASVMGLLFLVLFFGMFDMVLMLVWVVPLVFAEYSYHSDKQKKRTAAKQAEMLIAIEQELNGK